MKLNHVTAGRLEDYEERLLELTEDVRSASKYSRLLLEAAVHGGVIEDIPENLRECDPFQITEWAAEVVKHVNKSKQRPSGE